MVGPILNLYAFKQYMNEFTKTLICSLLYYLVDNIYFNIINIIYDTINLKN